MAGAYTDQRLNLSKLGKAFGRKPRFQTGPGKSGRPGFGKRKPWWDCEPVLQSKEQERKPLTYSGRARFLSQWSRSSPFGSGQPATGGTRCSMEGGSLRAMVRAV